MTRTGPSSSHSSHSYGSPRHGSSGGPNRRVPKHNLRNTAGSRRNTMEGGSHILLRNGPGAADNYNFEILRARGSTAAAAIAANPSFSPAAGSLALDSMGQFASADFEDFDLNITDFSGNNNNYNMVVQNVTAAGLAGLKTATDNFLQPLHVISRKRLREIISQGNNSLFGFLKRPDKTPTFGANSQAGQQFGDFLLKKYGAEIGNLKYLHSGKEQNFLKDINIDVSIKDCLAKIGDGLASRGESGNTVAQFIQQIRWISDELRQVSDNIMRLESLLQKKMDALDCISSRTAFLSGLKPNNNLPGLLDTFGAYCEEAYKANKIEEDFKELIESYKKWIILKDIVSLQKTVDQACSSGTSASGSPVTHAEPLCTICLTEGVSHAVVPCGHTFCQGCVKKQTLTCYICRGSIRDRIKIFLT